MEKWSEGEGEKQFVVFIQKSIFSDISNPYLYNCLEVVICSKQDNKSVLFQCLFTCSEFETIYFRYSVHFPKKKVKIHFPSCLFFIFTSYYLNLISRIALFICTTKEIEGITMLSSLTIVIIIPSPSSPQPTKQLYNTMIVVISFFQFFSTNFFPSEMYVRKFVVIFVNACYC